MRRSSRSLRTAFFMLLTSALGAYGCSNGSAEPTSEAPQVFDFLTVASAESTTIELVRHGDSCAVRKVGDDSAQKLDTPFPCGFVRSAQNKPAQSYAYENIGNVFVVAGVPAKSDEYPEDGNVDASHACAARGQVLFVKNGAIIPGKSMTRPLGFCHFLGFDEKDYYGFSHPIE